MLRLSRHRFHFVTGYRYPTRVWRLQEISPHEHSYFCVGVVLRSILDQIPQLHTLILEFVKTFPINRDIIFELQPWFDLCVSHLNRRAPPPGERVCRPYKLCMKSQVYWPTWLVDHPEGARAYVANLAASFPRTTPPGSSLFVEFYGLDGDLMDSVHVEFKGEST